MNAPLFQASQLQVTIAGKPVCSDLSFTVQTGERWGILGVNGVGKTTLLHVLAGLRPADAGEMRLGGTPLAQLPHRAVARQLGVLFQDVEDAFPCTVLEEALIGRHPHLDAWRWEGPEDMRLAREALDRVGLAGLEERITSTLSGGERRRLALAALLTQDPALFLLDEPSNHLDMHYQIAMLELFAGLKDKALIMVLHDVNLAARFCNRLLFLYGNGETEQGEAADLLCEDKLSHLYRHPIAAITAPGGRYFHPQ